MPFVVAAVGRQGAARRVVRMVRHLANSSAGGLALSTGCITSKWSRRARSVVRTSCCGARLIWPVGLTTSNRYTRRTVQ